MNRDDILKMEAGPKLNDLIAIHVMKWLPGYLKSTYIQLTAAEPNLRNCDDHNEFEEFDNNPISFFPSWDIAAAFEVLAKLGEVAWSLSPCWSLGTGKRIGFSFWIGGETTIAPTAPLAICKAVLLAVMEVT
jgi:hypothetical protein